MERSLQSRQRAKGSRLLRISKNLSVAYTSDLVVSPDVFNDYNHITRAYYTKAPATFSHPMVRSGRSAPHRHGPSSLSESEDAGLSCHRHRHTTTWEKMLGDSTCLTRSIRSLPTLRISFWRLGHPFHRSCNSPFSFCNLCIERSRSFVTGHLLA